VNVSSGTGSKGSPGQRAVKRLLLLLLLLQVMTSYQENTTKQPVEC